MSKGAFKNFKFKNINFKNKVIMAPESSNSASKDGLASEFHIKHYGSSALSGVGTVVIERTAVSKEGRKSDKDLGIWSDRHIKGLKKISSLVKNRDIVVGVQLYHNEIKFDNSIEEFSNDDIKSVIKSFKKATKRALRAGFDFVEISGDVITQFLSKKLNKREDKYGGSFENRVKLLKEITSAVSDVWGKDKVLAVRLCAELYETDIEKKELSKIIGILRKEGVDLINLSTDNEFDTNQKAKAKVLEKELPMVEGGLINIATNDEDIINTQHGLVFLGQAILRDSYWVINEFKSFITGSKYLDGIA